MAAPALRQSRAREAVRIFGAYSRLEAIEDISYPMSTLLQHFRVVFPVFIYFFIAQLVPGSRESGGGRVGGDYFTFSVVGLSASTLLLAAISGFGQRLQRAQDQGHFEALLVEPVPWILIPFAMNLWKIVVGVVGAALLLGVGVAMGADLRVAGIPLFVGMMTLGTLACVAIGVLSASLMVLAKRSQAILTLYGFVASLLGGALFPIELLPRWMRALSYLVPHAYVIAVSRTALMVEPPPTTITSAEATIALTAFIVVVLGAGLFAFSRSLQYARKMGLLSGY